jgi:hypothetical protein
MCALSALVQAVLLLLTYLYMLIIVCIFYVITASSVFIFEIVILFRNIFCVILFKNKLDQELQELDKRLQQKEVLISCLNLIWVPSNMSFEAKFYFNHKAYCHVFWFSLKSIVTHHLFMFQQAEMKQFANSDTSVLKQHYEKKLQEKNLFRLLVRCLVVTDVFPLPMHADRVYSHYGCFKQLMHFQLV